MISFYITTFKIIVGIYRNSAKRINNFYKPCKIHFKIIIDVRIIKHTQCIHRHICTINTRMGQLIRNTAGNRQWHIIITWSGNHQNLSCFNIGSNNNIDITSCIDNFISSSINTTHIDLYNIFILQF